MGLNEKPVTREWRARREPSQGLTLAKAYMTPQATQGDEVSLRLFIQGGVLINLVMHYQDAKDFAEDLREAAVDSAARAWSMRGESTHPHHQENE